MTTKPFYWRFEMTTFKLPNSQPLQLDQQLGEGGEGWIYAVKGTSSSVAKIYKISTPLHAAKLRAMLANSPADPTLHLNHISIAWPSELILTPQGSVAGFLMPRIDYKASVPLLKLYNRRDRQQTAPNFTWKYLLHTALNLASVVEAVHARGYVVGDLNESNLLVSSRALVSLVDCDSMQVSAGNGQVFRCPVGKAEYTPPELQGVDFKSVDRHPSHDNFGLAVLIFMLLMEGVHPYAGISKVTGTPPTEAENIRDGNCPYTDKTGKIAPPRHALPFDALPPGVQSLMVRCFGAGHRNPGVRPAPQEWRSALEHAETSLARCKTNRQHVYSDHLGKKCPWCERLRKGMGDSFPQPGKQIPLRAAPFVRTAPPAPIKRPAPVMLPPSPSPPVSIPRRRRRWRKAIAVPLVGALLSAGAIGYNGGEIPPLPGWMMSQLPPTLQEKLVGWGWSSSPTPTPRIARQPEPTKVQQSGPKVLYVNAARLGALAGANLRAHPGMRSASKLLVAHGAQVQVSKKPIKGPDGNEWYEVVYRGMRGYMPASLLSAQKPAPITTGDRPKATMTATPTRQRMIALFVNAGVPGARMHAQPSKKARTLSLLTSGTSVWVLPRPAKGTDGGSWYAVTHKGKRGYVPASLLSQQKPEPTVTLYVDAADQGYRGGNVRERPSARSKKVGYLLNGTSVQASKSPVIGDDGNPWYKVTYQGKTGYVLGSLLVGGR